MAGNRYRWLLRLLPPSFREQYEPELIRTWRQDHRDSGRVFWLRAIVDILATAPLEYAHTFARNCRFAARQLRRTPSFTAAAILTLAVGVGATSGVFTLVNAVLLRPLPWASPDTVGLIWAVQPSGDRTWLSFPELEDLQAAMPGLSGVVGLTDLRMTMVSPSATEELQVLAVSHAMFGLLGVSPQRGRDFTREDDLEGAAPVALLSDAFWRRQFGGAPDTIGRTMMLNDREYEIIGVLPPAFSLLPASTVLPDRVDVWVTLEPHLASRQRSVRFLHALARLEAGATFAQADSQIRAFASRMTAQDATAYAKGTWSLTVVSFKDDVLRSARTTLWLLFGLVCLVLLMACINVTHLLLARGESRRMELAVRSALGAGPARLAGEQLAEVCLLGVSGGLLGCVLAAATPVILRSRDTAGLPRLAEATVDYRVLAFMIGLVFLTVLVSAAAVPVIERVARPRSSLVVASRSGGRTRRSARIGQVLVIVQAGFATAIIVTAVSLSRFGVAQRLREFGVRLAIGASPGSVRAVLMGEGMTLTAIGVAVGLAGAAGASHLLRLVSLEAEPTSLTPYMIGMAIVSGSSMLALLIPARRAGQVEPVTVLGSD